MAMRAIMGQGAMGARAIMVAAATQTVAAIHAPVWRAGQEMTATKAQVVTVTHAHHLARLGAPQVVAATAAHVQQAGVGQRAITQQGATAARVQTEARARQMVIATLARVPITIEASTATRHRSSRRRRRRHHLAIAIWLAARTATLARARPAAAERQHDVACRDWGHILYSNGILML